MGADSKIEWTHATFNPWWGCTRVSPGCEHCYAETFAKRVGVKWGVQADRRFFSDKHWAEPLKWNAAAAKAGERRRVFCASMADVFEDRRDLDEQRARLWALINITPHLDWLLLTKRPENMVRLADARWINGWPRNVWAGCTVEDQRRADERIPHLLQVPAAIRFLSCEPLLGPVEFSDVTGRSDAVSQFGKKALSGIDWIIVGGESGHGARPFNLAWARGIVAQCRAAGVAVHVKQLGAWPIPESHPGETIADMSGQRIKQYVNGLEQRLALAFKDKKGGDWDEWPPDLRVREYPEPRQ